MSAVVSIPRYPADVTPDMAVGGAERTRRTRRGVRCRRRGHRHRADRGDLSRDGHATQRIRVTCRKRS